MPELLLIYSPENLPHVPADKILGVLFEILTVLPEEVGYCLKSSYNTLVSSISFIIKYLFLSLQFFIFLVFFYTFASAS